MPAHLVVPRTALVPTEAPSSHTLVEPPRLRSIRAVLGVGPDRDTPPALDRFSPTYAVTVQDVGGLDEDGVYEFDALSLFAMVARRSLQRVWGLRLEFDFDQPTSTSSLADVYFTAPFDEDDGTLAIIDTTTSDRAETRTITVTTAPVTEPKRAGILNGRYAVQLRDATSNSDEKPKARSLARGITVDLTRFEFET